MKKIIFLLLIAFTACRKDAKYLDGQKASPDSTLVQYNDNGNDLSENGVPLKEPLTVVSSDHTALYDGWQYTCHDANNPHQYYIFAYNQIEKY